ncbi:hypothetical protein [Coprobacillus sp. AF33-1AC]|uniref:hypothetical protein n=1 Tax=Coprobacillus sp. AF33-1AC TaxID=2292032 RepID=UPI001F2E07F6|nr:hypothetical protein [Coprobacillus sp. AF33-1AC]
MNYVKTGWALLPPIIAIIWALKTKEVYLSLFIGVISGTLLLSQFDIIKGIDLLFDTFIQCLSQSTHISIL